MCKADAHEAVDEVRRAEVPKATTEDERTALKRTHWALQKNPWNLTALESEKLTKLPRANKRLFRAYLLKEALAGILDDKQAHVARRKLGEWTSWAARSRLDSFRKLAGTVRRYEERILAYISSQLSNGRTEALNGKARTITCRAYGLHSASALIALLKLCCSGIELVPSRCGQDPPTKPLGEPNIMRPPTRRPGHSSHLSVPRRPKTLHVVALEPGFVPTRAHPTCCTRVGSPTCANPPIGG